MIELKPKYRIAFPDRMDNELFIEMARFFVGTSTGVVPDPGDLATLFDNA